MSPRVLDAGPSVTVQDLGRPGFAALGVPPSGAMDTWALRVANLLVGNDEATAGIELALVGATFAFDEDVVVALTGATFECHLDGIEPPQSESFRVEAGRTLTLGRMREGARGYLAVRGGIDVPVVLGSRSTHVAAGLGGFEGRALAAGDDLAIGHMRSGGLDRSLTSKVLPMPATDQAVRVVVGPQEAAFTSRGLDAFLSSVYTVSPRSDRVGVRLEGPAIEHAGSSDLDPEGVVTGAIQVPGDGLPIVLGPDRPVTGGYVKIATVIRADLPLIAQARPGATLRFVAVEVEEARAAWEERERVLHAAIREP